MTSVARKVCERRRRRRTPAYWLALTGWAVIGAAHAAVEVRVTPAWDGFVHLGATTELSVHLRAAQPTAVSLTAHSDGLELEQRVTLAAATLERIALLVRPRDGMAWIDIIAPADDVASQPVALRTTARPIVAAASEAIGPDRTWDEVELVRAATESWPHHAEAYSSVDAVLIDGAHLAALDGEQRTALETYSAGCGRLLYTGGDPLPPALRGGCGGQFSRAVIDAEALPATAALLRQEPPPLPTGTALLTLLDNAASRTLPVAALLCAYAALLLWLAHSLRRPPLLLALPPLAALLAVLAFTATPSRLDRVRWLEWDSGDAHARGTLVTTVIGTARGRTVLQEPAGWQLPEAVDGGSVSLDDTGRLVLKTGLLSREAHVARGVQAPPMGLQLAVSDAGPRITNAADEPSAPAVLSWRGAHHAVPSLAPGTEWTPQSSTPWSDAAAERLLRARSPPDGAALLVPLRPDSDGTAAWLLIRPAQAQS